MNNPPVLFKLEVRRMHPEIVTAALVQLCQVVLLCKYIFSAVFSILAAETSHKDWIFLLRCDAKEGQGGSVKCDIALFDALRNRISCLWMRRDRRCTT